MFKGMKKRNRFFQKTERNRQGSVVRAVTYEIKSGQRVYVAHDTAGKRKVGEFAGYGYALLPVHPDTQGAHMLQTIRRMRAAV